MKTPRFRDSGILLAATLLVSLLPLSAFEKKAASPPNETSAPQAAPSPAGEKADAGLEALRAKRREAAQRKRRVIYNNDGNETFRKVREVSVEAFLKPRTTGIEGSQVDAISYCTGHAWGLFGHGTKIGTVLDVKESPGETTQLFGNNLTREYLQAGLDPLRMIVDFGHANKMEVFWSMRMNDTHDGGDKTPYGKALFAYNRLKNEHPEFLVGTRENPPANGSWSAVDYANPAVRDHTFRFMQEVCQNYDIDGIDLDFFRHRVFFKSTANGKDATPEEVAAMTDLMRRIRRMTEEEGLKRGRPILVIMRVPDSAAYAKAAGLDIEEWLKEGLLDLMVVSSYIQLNPWEVSVALGHKYGVPVYPSLDEARLKDEDSQALRYRSELGLRGRALNAWKAGVDGIYTFNFFDPASRLWRELGDPDVLAKLDKDYFASFRGVGAPAGVPHESYITLPTLNPGAPLKIEAGGANETQFRCGDDPDRIGKATLRLRFKAPAETGLLSVALNGTPLANPRQEKDWLAFDLDPKTLKSGPNAVRVSLAAAASRPALWTDLHMQVRQEQSQ